MRRSSRAVCSNLAEAYGKRNYRRHFISKITDAEMENYEVASWDDISLGCKYITNQQYEQLTGLNEEVGKLLNYMRQYPEKFSSSRK